MAHWLACSHSINCCACVMCSVLASQVNARFVWRKRLLLLLLVVVLVLPLLLLFFRGFTISVGNKQTTQHTYTCSSTHQKCVAIKENKANFAYYYYIFAYSAAHRNSNNNKEKKIGCYASTEEKSQKINKLLHYPLRYTDGLCVWVWVWMQSNSFRWLLMNVPILPNHWTHTHTHSSDLHATRNSINRENDLSVLFASSHAVKMQKKIIVCYRRRCRMLCGKYRMCTKLNRGQFDGKPKCVCVCHSISPLLSLPPYVFLCAWENLRCKRG